VLVLCNNNRFPFSKFATDGTDFLRIAFRHSGNRAIVRLLGCAEADRVSMDGEVGGGGIGFADARRSPQHQTANVDLRICDDEGDALLFGGVEVPSKFFKKRTLSRDRPWANKCRARHSKCVSITGSRSARRPTATSTWKRRRLHRPPCAAAKSSHRENLIPELYL
jgi:hypothetical protein